MNEGRSARPPAQRAASAKRRRRTIAGRDLLSPRVQAPLLLLVIALATLFAWQVRRPFMLDVGAPNDGPYLVGFHDSEIARDTGLAYRWTRGPARITIPGYGATDASLILRLQGGRPDGAPPPTLTIALGDRSPLILPLEPGLRDYQFAVPASAFRDGTLRVALDAPTFRPSGDARDLGIVVARAELRDAGGAGGLIAPPLGILATLLLCALTAYAAAAILLRAPLAGAVAGWSTALALLTFAIRSRFALASFAPRLTTIAILVAALAILVGLAAWWLGRRLGWSVSPRALGGATLIAGTLLLALLLGMRHPQFRSSDLLLNVHRLEFAERGEWIFTLALPGTRAIEAPYPPLFYAAMLPFAALVSDKALLVEVIAALAIAAGALLTFALARHLTGRDGPALWAAGVYTVLPIVPIMASSGNFANLFGQLPANAYLLALVVTRGRWRRPAIAAGLTALLVLALLGHFGVFLALLAAVPLIALVLAGGGQEARGQALALVGSFAVALLLAYAIYYRFQTDTILTIARELLGGDPNARGGEAARVTFAQRLRNTANLPLVHWGWPAVPLAVWGVVALRRARPSPALTIALVWLATAIPFAAGDLIAGLSVRYALFVAPALALAAGWALDRLGHSHRRAGPALSLAIGAVWLWQCLAVWVERVLHAYH